MYNKVYQYINAGNMDMWYDVTFLENDFPLFNQFSSFLTTREVKHFFNNGLENIFHLKEREPLFHFSSLPLLPFH